jgi:hypothetical protein
MGVRTRLLALGGLAQRLLFFSDQRARGSDFHTGLKHFTRRGSHKLFTGFDLGLTPARESFAPSHGQQRVLETRSRARGGGCDLAA